VPTSPSQRTLWHALGLKPINTPFCSPQSNGMAERFVYTNARAAAEQCAPDTGALNLLAELQRRADSRAGALARIADDARRRGSACERAYDSSQAMSQAAQ
jgi:transposase InsO family protein